MPTHMTFPLKISAKELCRLLSADKNSLNAIEQALLAALEATHTVDDLLIIKENACLRSQADLIPIGNFSATAL